MPPAITSFVRLVFVIALGFTLIQATIPPQHALHLLPWDKAEHFLAFYVLSLCASVAFPRRDLLWIAAWLATFGAAIEIVQALPILQRDCDWQDWLADLVAIAAALGPMALAPWRANNTR